MVDGVRSMSSGDRRDQDVAADVVGADGETEGASKRHRDGHDDQGIGGRRSPARGQCHAWRWLTAAKSLRRYAGLLRAIRSSRPRSRRCCSPAPPSDKGQADGPC